ncbi:MAG: hypothetical protein ACLQSR_06485 [Limisphaerales bacterium]
MSLRRPIEDSWTRGLLGMMAGVALNSSAQNWPAVTQPSQPFSQSPPAASQTPAAPTQPSPEPFQQPVQSPAQPPSQQTAPANPVLNWAQPQNSGPNKLEHHDWQLEKIPDYDWSRHFRIGMLVGFNIKANFTMSGSFAIPPGQSGIYDDGYVLTDSRGVAGDNVVGTGNFGFDNASQVSGSTLLLHQATGFTVANGNSSGDNSPYVGVDLAYGDSYWYWERAKLGWEFGFGFLPIHIVGNATINVTRNQYSFNNQGLPLSLLPAGYQGGFDASGDGGAAVSPTASGASGTPSTDTVPGTTSESLNVDLYTFRLGPTLYWNLSRSIGLYAGAGPAVGLVSGDLSSSGVIKLSDGSTASYNASHIDGTSMVYGGYVNATLVYHVEEGGDFYLGAQYMPMNGASISGSGASSHLDLSGQVYLTTGINWPF